MKSPKTNLLVQRRICSRSWILRRRTRFNPAAIGPRMPGVCPASLGGSLPIFVKWECLSNLRRPRARLQSALLKLELRPGFCDACDAPDASASQSVDASQNPVLFLKSSSEELQSSAPPQIPRLRPMAVTPRRPSTLVTPAGRLACGVTRAATSSVGTVIPLPLRTT